MLQQKTLNHKEATTMAKVQGTKVITNEVRFSYVNVFEPKQFENQPEPQYQVCILIPKSDTETVDVIKQAIAQAQQDGLPKWGGKLPKKMWDPLRDGDVEHPEDPAFEDVYYLNAKSRTKPGVVDKYRANIDDPSVFYSGCYGRASVSFFAFAAAGNNGVGVSLNNLQKFRDGERLAGRANASDDFDDLEDGDDDFLG